jgi:hypothetical protein
MLGRINGGLKDKNFDEASKTILRAWDNFVIIAIIQYILMCLIIALLSVGIYKGIKYIDKHGLKNLVERVWNGERK